MAILPVIHAPDPRLRVKSEQVETLNDEIRHLLDDMLETMYAELGIGLSAIQVGVPKRVVVLDVARSGEPRTPYRLVNPEIISTSMAGVSMDEGCLSFPDQFSKVKRPEKVDVSYLDEHGNQQTLTADGLLSRCIQHEIDHLDGILFVDYLSALRRNMILRKLAKQKKGRLRDIA